MALTKQQIHNNKIKFESILRNLNREGNIEELINFLNSSDFFFAPSTTQYHYSYEGGLCEHSLNTFQELMNLSYDVEENSIINKYDYTTLAIVGLLYNVSKINYYEKYIQNKKVYSPSGTKYDEMGKYDWHSIYSYKVIDSSERFIAGDSGFNSYMIISRYISLNDEEIIALKNYNCGMDNNYMMRDLPSILNKYPLVTLLHIADMYSSYIATKMTWGENSESLN